MPAAMDSCFGFLRSYQGDIAMLGRLVSYAMLTRPKNAEAAVHGCKHSGSFYGIFKGYARFVAIKVALKFGT